MRSSLPHPVQLEQVHAQGALVVAPHYDDEILGCGGLLAQLTAAEAAVRVLFLSDGSGGVEDVTDRPAYSARRSAEAAKVAEVLGLAGIAELRLPDGALEQHVEAMAEAIGRELLEHRPEVLLVTSPLEVTADHRAAFRAVHRLLGGVRPGSELVEVVRALRILAYEVNHPLYPNLLVDVSAQIPQIRRAMECYASQEERHGYLEARLGLLRYRTHTFPPGVEAVEAYRVLEPIDFISHSPARLVAALGGAPEVLEVREGTKISVVVRTKDRPELLRQALESLARSSYRRFEVVLVNDSGAPPALPVDYPVEIIRVDLDNDRGRAAAANAGVAAATGEHVAFLDDDDLADPEHLATLAGLVAAAGVRVAYTDAAVGVYVLDPEEGWRCKERRLPYSRDFDPDLLLFDNYIPFNTLLIERELFAEVGELDEGLPFFEDWDFLIRLARRTPFHHLSRVTCEYRQFRGGGHHVLGDRPRERADFLEMKARVIARHAEWQTPAARARVIDLLRAEAVAAQEETTRARREQREQGGRYHELEERYHALNGRFTSVDLHRQMLEATLERDRSELATLGAELQGLREQRLRSDHELRRLYQREDELEERLRRTYGEIERLGGILRTMESTRAWRLHQWWQRHKP